MSVHLEWKTVPEDPNNIWIVLTAFGVVGLELTREKLGKLQDTMDYFVEHFSATHKFTLLFDFSQCEDFAKMGMLTDLKSFLTKNDKLLETHLRESFILLRDPAWRFWTKVIFAFRKPKQPYAFEMADKALYEALRFKL